MCLHSNTVDDDRQGETICTDCGVVIGPIYYHQHYFGKEEEEKSESSSSSSSPPPPPPPPSPSKRRSTSPIYLTEVNKHIRHICANAHICDAVCDYAISIVSSTVRNNNNNNTHQQSKDGRYCRVRYLCSVCKNELPPTNG